MSQIEKLKRKFYEKPIRNDMTFNEICLMAKYYGCDVESGGKHMHIVHAKTGTVIPIPRHGKSVGEAYIKQLKELFDEIAANKEM